MLIAPSSSIGSLYTAREPSPPVFLSAPLTWGRMGSTLSDSEASVKALSPTSSYWDVSALAPAGSRTFCTVTPARTRATSWDLSSSYYYFLESSLNWRIESEDIALVSPLGLRDLFVSFFFFEPGKPGAPFLFFSLACFGAGGWERISSLDGGLISTFFPRPTKEKR